MNLPQITIQSQPAKLGIQANRGDQQLEQPRAGMDMRTTRPQLQMERQEPRLEVNQDRAWDALALGNNLETMSKIYTMAKDIALQGLARIVENGNRMRQIHINTNPFAEMAMDWKRTFPEFDFRGPASVLNVDMMFHPGGLSVEVQEGRSDLNVTVNPPIHNYSIGKLDIYMEHYGSVEIIPPRLDMTG